jgi:hypothetical protein
VHKFFCLNPYWSFQGPSLKAPKHVECKKKFIQHPTFSVENWRPNAKKLASTPSIKLQNLELENSKTCRRELFCAGFKWNFRAPNLEAPRRVDAKNFVFGLQL